VNTYFVQLELATGMCNVTRMAATVGAKSSVDSAPVTSYDDKPSFTLGTVEVSPLSMADAYATFASGGIHCDPIIVSKITTATGRRLAPPSANCRRVISADVANAVNKILSGVVTTGSAPKARLDDHRPMAGKTGTIESNAAVWFVGYTPEVAGAAMISIDTTRKPFAKSKPGYRSTGLKGYTIPSNHRYLSGSGGGDAGPGIWKPAVTKYLADKPKTPFGTPSDAMVHGKKVPMPDIKGLSPAQAIAKLRAAGLTVVRDSRPSDTVPAGKLIGFSPSSGEVPQYGTVKAVYSTGKPRSRSSGPATTKPPTRTPAKHPGHTPRSGR
jgi:membrane peptidoglycan carboxypeptidase